MHPQVYPIPEGLHPIPTHLLDLRPDSEIDHDLLHPKPISNEKNIWFFWHTGYTNMHPYAQRNIRAWYRRFSPQGWSIRVLDRLLSSPLNVSNFLNTSDPGTFPRAFTDGTIRGDYAAQHTSDLVRLPLLLKYGGVYADVGFIQIGDLDRLWRETIGNPSSRFQVLSYDAGGIEGRTLTNYFLASGRDNPLFARCHRLLLRVWEADGGKTSTDGMHGSPLLKEVPLMGGEFTIEEEGRTIGKEEVSRMLTDYIIQGHVMTMVMGLVDEEDGWDGPEYVDKHVYAIEFMVGSQLINQMTAWNGQKAFYLLSLLLPKEGEVESAEQKEARAIVEACLQRSFGFKLAHGLILRVFGDTLGTLWKKHEGSDDVLGTYAHWLRYGCIYWNQDRIPPTLQFRVTEPFKRGPLLREV
jgi:Capsular polysaccharide synthesis protein